MKKSAVKTSLTSPVLDVVQKVCNGNRRIDIQQINIDRIDRGFTECDIQLDDRCMHNRYRHCHYEQ